MKCILLAVGLFIVGGLGPLAAQTFTPLYSFTKSTDGASPGGSLVQGSDGRLYGTTTGIGTSGYGTVFAVKTDGTSFTTLHSFANGADGGRPQAALIQGSDGRLYGTTATGGSNYGTVFAVKTDGTSFTTLYTFQGSTDGGGSYAGLLQGSDGRLYGTTSYGGAYGAGTVFALNPNGTSFTVLYTFIDSNDGAAPRASLIQGTDGRLYGTAVQGGAFGGTVFALATNGGNFTTLHSFDGSDGYGPYAAVIQGSDGRLYGTTTTGGANNFGTVFALNTDGSGFTPLYNFTNGTDGQSIGAGVIQGSDHRLYGTATAGGAYYYGTVFALSITGTGFTTLHSFTGGTDGSGPTAGLVQGSDGRFYGATPAGGANGGGAIYAYNVNIPPVFTVNPASQTVNAGQTAVFTAVASGATAYQWTFNGVTISGATSATLTLVNVAAASAGLYAVTATDIGGSTTSSSATLTVDTAPAFTVSPVSVTIASGRSAAFSVSASGTPNSITYQWYLNSGIISGATDPILLVQSASSSKAGSYTCVATNSVGSTTSSAGTLTVDSTGTPGYLINISARGDVGILPGDAGPGILFGGVGLSGTGTKSLLIRGIGPGLVYAFPSLFTSADVVTDPQLSLLTTTVPATQVAQNDNWGGGSTLTNAFTQTGAFSIPSNSLDAALLTTVPVANYNIQVTTTGTGSATGTGMVEVYDADTGTPTARITNLAARDYVGTGNHILIGGFAVRGTDYETLLIRSLGPTLSQSGLTNVLAQPVVTIVSGQTAIYSNTGWGGDSTLASVMLNTAGNSPGSASQDSVLLVSLPPGNYTIEVSGANGGTGQATVEFYDVP